MAAGLVLGMAGCAKDGPDAGKPQDGDNANLKIAITVPNSAATRAVAGEPGADSGEDIATAEGESDVNWVTVYVFGANGVAATTGGAKTIPWADFKLGTGDDAGKHVLDAAYEVTSGNSRIYVGLNVPADMQSFATESALLAATGVIGKNTTGDTKLDRLANLTMFSEVMVQNLEPFNEDEPNIQTVDADLRRVASKVVATSSKHTHATDPATTWSNEVVLSYNVLEYNVYNEATAGYLVKKTDGTTLSNPINDFDTSYAKGNATVQVGNNYVFDNVALSNLGADYFIAENNSKLIPENEGLARNGNTTYAMIATQVHVSKTAILNSDGEIVWEGAANNVAESDEANLTADDLWIVVKDAQTYIVKGAPDVKIDPADPDNNMNSVAVAIQDKMYADELAKRKAELITGGMTEAQADAQIALEADAIKATFHIYRYAKSYVHFMVWLNKEGSNDYNIGRNEFIHIEVNGVRGLDGFFPGYPGDPTDPKKPIDPEDEEDPNNPDPKDPEQPVDPEPAMLVVKITVKPWTYRYNGAILQ